MDRALGAVREITSQPALVNFGGDLCVSGPRSSGARWKVAIESVEEDGRVAGLLELADGALATSGDARRFLLKNGIRYGHILDPRSGRPVKNAPRSVTVAARTCVAAGLTATLAMLHGKRAETSQARGCSRLVRSMSRYPPEARRTGFDGQTSPPHTRTSKVLRKVQLGGNTRPSARSFTGMYAIASAE